MSLKFAWDTVNSPADSNAQYCIGAKSVAAVDITNTLGDGQFGVDGSEIDTLPELDRRAFSIMAWISLSRLPLGADPSPSYNFVREKFGIVGFDVIQGGAGGSTLTNDGLWIQGTAGNGPPRLIFNLVRQFSNDLAQAQAGLPSFSDPTGWVFVAGTNVVDDGVGPHLYTGGLGTPVSEVAYIGQGGGSGPIGSSFQPGPSVSGVNPLVSRWIFGPVMIGCICRQVPVNGPNQHYGLNLSTNTGRGAMQGRVANVVITNGAMSLAQLEWFRANAGMFSTGTGPKPPGNPFVVANWSLDDVGTTQFDRSGRGHDLSVVGPVARSTRPSFERTGYVV